MDEYAIIKGVEMDGWEIPFVNEFEDTSCHMVCPDRNAIDVTKEKSFCIIDFISSDAYSPSSYTNQSSNVSQQEYFEIVLYASLSSYYRLREIS